MLSEPSNEERVELKSLKCHNGVMKIKLKSNRRRKREKNLVEGVIKKHRNVEKNITLSDTECRFVASKENEDEMVLETQYGKCGAIVHQTGKISLSSKSFI